MKTGVIMLTNHALQGTTTNENGFLEFRSQNSEFRMKKPSGPTLEKLLKVANWPFVLILYSVF